MIYKYKAITKEGETIEGFFEASEESDVLTMLKTNDYLPVSVEKDIGASAQISLFSSKVKKKDLAVFCRQFYTMVDAGIGIVKCFDILEAQTSNKTLKAALKAIYEDVQKGFTISEAMNNHANVFPPILINMIEAGEVSGTLDTILERMANHFEQENKLESKIKSALIYPTALIVVSISVVIFMLVAVLPTFIGMFDGSGTALPWPTQILLDMSSWLQNYLYIFGLAVIIILVGGIYFISTVEGRKFIDGLKIKIPGIRVTNSKIITSVHKDPIYPYGIRYSTASSFGGSRKGPKQCGCPDKLTNSMDGIRRSSPIKGGEVNGDIPTNGGLHDQHRGNQEH